VPYPKKPDEQKRRIGNPGKRKLPEHGSVTPLKPLAVGEMPGGLGEAGKAMWAHVVAHASAWVGVPDHGTLALLCEAADRRVLLLERLRADGYVLFTDKGYAYQHPAAGLLTALEAQMTKWLGALALTPTDRSRLGVAEVREDELDRFRARKEQRGAGG
jgi:P27 family predicted phage terminase small subunit